MSSLPVFLFSSFCLVASAAGQAVYIDQTAQVGFDAVHDPVQGHPSIMLVGGGTVGDFNNDGWPDVFMPSGGERPDYLYINDGDGTFTESAVAWGLTDLHLGIGSAVGDVNGDGWQDLYVCSFGVPGDMTLGQNRLYRNNGDNSFTEVAAFAGVDAPSSMNNCYGAAFGDYNEDGALDLFVSAYSFGGTGNTLYQNNGDGTFTDVTSAAGMDPLRTSRGFVPNFVDMDQDGWQDMLLIADTGTSKYYRNQGDGTFSNESAWMPDLSSPNGMGQATGDFDNDGDLDFYVSDIYYPISGIGGNRLFENDGSNQYWRSIAGNAGVRETMWAWGVVATDMDNDGWLDLASTNGWFSSWENRPSHLFHNQKDGTFAEVSASCGMVHTGQGRSFVRLDADRDGDEDLIIFASNGPMTYFENETNNGNHWLRISFDTRARPDLAPHGYGTQVRIRDPRRSAYRQLDSQVSFLGQSELTMHLGLNDREVVPELEVEWADGTIRTFYDIPADQHLVITASEPLLTSSAAQVQSPFSVQINGMASWATGYLVNSSAGPGPTSTIYGELSVSEPWTVMPFQADAMGCFEDKVNIPIWMAGRTLYMQAVDLTSNSLTNPISVQVQ